MSDSTNIADREGPATLDEVRGIAWWNALAEPARAFWLARTNNCTATEAWAAFKRGTHGR